MYENMNIWTQNRITEWLRLDRNSEDHPVQPPVKQGYLWHVAWDHIQEDFEYFQKRLHSLSGKPVAVLCHTYSKEVPSHIQLKLSVL